MPDQIKNHTENGTTGLVPALLPLYGQPDALPVIDNGISIYDEERTVELLSAVREHRDEIDAYDFCGLYILNKWMVGPLTLIRKWLRGFRYVGPVRELPSRNYEPPRMSDESRWASGLAAWDLLHTTPHSSIDQVNEWLGPERLATGTTITRRDLKQVPCEMLDTLIELDPRTTDDTMDEFDNDNLNLVADADRLPIHKRVFLVDQRSGIDCQVQDVGVGMAQLVPVVVGAVDRKTNLLVVEQPELHLHPRVQAEMGDLFLTECLSKENPKQFLLETHSEHLILRLLRRVREGALAPDQLAVYYVDPGETGSTIKRLRIDPDGEFIDKWPQGFFDERAEELF